MDARDLCTASSLARSAAPAVTRSRHPTWSFRGVGRRTRVVRLASPSRSSAGRCSPSRSSPLRTTVASSPAANVGIVVLDVSTSVKPSTYDLIREQLAGLSSTSRRFGVVLFSDVAYEALPPATPARELRKFVRFFGSELRYDEEGNVPALAMGAVVLGRHVDLLRPAARRHLLEQRPYADRGVVLISDLADDPSDFQKLADTIALYSRRSIPLNVVALDPTPGRPRVLPRAPRQPRRDQQRPAADGADRARQPRDRIRLPVDDAVVAAFVVAVLAASMYWTEPLQWRRRRA